MSQLFFDGFFASPKMFGEIQDIKVECYADCWSFFLIRLESSGKTEKPLRTALHVAAQNNDVDGICRLLEWGADVNICDHKKRTPIHLAAMGGHTQVRGGGVPDICADISADHRQKILQKTPLCFWPCSLPCCLGFDFFFGWGVCS